MPVPCDNLSRHSGALGQLLNLASCPSETGDQYAIQRGKRCLTGHSLNGSLQSVVDADSAAPRSSTGDRADLSDAYDEFLELLNRPSGHADAACRGLDRRRWFADHDETTTEARMICAGCPVSIDCLAAALVDPATAGIWGACPPGNAARCEPGQRRDTLMTQTTPNHPVQVGSGQILKGQVGALIELSPQVDEPFRSVQRHQAPAHDGHGRLMTVF
jgi:hypothetical protein